MPAPTRWIGRLAIALLTMIGLAAMLARSIITSQTAQITTMKRLLVSLPAA